jgi:hypothetical protein
MPIGKFILTPIANSRKSLHGKIVMLSQPGWAQIAAPLICVRGST